MYAIVKIAGRQYRLAENDRIKVNRLPSEPGQEMVCSEVLAAGEGASIQFGTPRLPARVKLEVLSHGRYPKVYNYHFKRRGGRRRLHGHRQEYTLVRVKSVEMEA